MRRKPSVAGYFYPDSASSLRDQIEGMVDLHAKKIKAIGVISPHAGYIYSGKVAGSVFSSVVLPDHYIIMGPNHQDVSVSMSIVKQGVWETPLGELPIDTVLAELLMEKTALLKENEKSHLKEHSLEVQLPFIQYLKGRISFVPISIGHFAAYEELVELGRAIAGALEEYGQEVLIVASTDMSHYVSQEVAEKLDFLAIQKILDLDAEGLFNVVRMRNISMCGMKPTASAIVASKELKAEKGELIKYQTSGDISGDYMNVVGYAGIRII